MCGHLVTALFLRQPIQVGHFPKARSHTFIRSPAFIQCCSQQLGTAVFRTQVNLIGETIDVVLRPSYLWSFGDGSFFATTDPGGPFPEGKVTHIYSQPGIYPVLLTTTWNGSFSHNAVERAITGQIKKVSALTITVVAAPTRFMN